MLRLKVSSAVNGFARLSLYGGKTLLSSKQETGKEKSATGLGEARAPETPAAARPVEGLQRELWCKWKCLLDLLTSAKMCGAKTVMKQEGSSTTTAEGARRREDEETCLFSLQSCRQAQPSLRGHWVTEETVLLHAGLCSPKWLLKTCIFRALSVTR